MEDGKVFLQIPVQLLRGFLKNPLKRYEAINDMIAYAVFDVFRKFTKTGKDQDTVLPKVYDFLGVTNKGGIEAMKKTLNRGDEIASTIKTKSCFFIDKHRLFELRDKTFSYDLYVAMTMYFALGSIQGKEPYWKATNLFLLSRMDGKDKTVSSAERLSAPIKKINTRRKLDKYKGILEEHYGVSFFGYGVRGFFFSTKLSEKELIEKIVITKVKPKNSVKKLRKSQKDVYEKMWENGEL